MMMMMKKNSKGMRTKTMTQPEKKTVPPQITGNQTHTAYTVMLSSFEESRQRFQEARERLLDVNHWHQLAGPLSANFTLTDDVGHILDHKAQEGDHIRIDLPAPGSKTGNGYDWVEIEKIEDKVTSSGKTAYVAIRVRPSGNPQQRSSKVAHFYDPAATSSFVVELSGKCVKASVYGRNEQPNTTPSNFWDKLRNTLIAVTASLGFSKPQWKRLAKGLVK
jgi:hypothetical protein